MTKDSQIATTAGNAPVPDLDVESTRSHPPEQPAAVVYRTFQAGGWFYAPFPVYAGHPGRWLPEDEYQRLVAR